MFCIHCGKKAPDIALFCPHCGKPIEPIEDDTPAPAPEPKPEPPKDTFPDEVSDGFESSLEGMPSPSPAEGFVPLEQALKEQPAELPKKKPAPQDSFDSSDLFHTEDEPGLHLTGAKPVLGGSRNDGGDMFLSGEEDFDSDPVHRSVWENDWDYEEPESPSFLVRHVRGLVGTALTAMLVLILFIWACTGTGQRTLAGINLAWTSGAYAELGRDAFEDGSFKTAARYYEKAFEKDSTDYVLAYNAGVCYEKYGDKERAEQFYILAIQADPSQLNPYVALRNLYPDLSVMTQEVRNLIDQGYLKTGDGRLKLD